MSLTKPFQQTYVAGVIGQAYVAPYKVCQELGPAGYWDYQCSSEDVTAQYKAGSVFLSAPSYLLLVYADGTRIKSDSLGVTVLAKGTQWTTNALTGAGGTSAALTSATRYTCAAVWVSEPGGSNVVCTDYPGQPFIAAVPATIKVTPYAAWDGGANSEDAQDGDCEVKLTMGLVVGVMVGLIADVDAADVTDTSRLTHAFYFHQNASARPQYSVVESGRTVRAAAEYTVGDTFAIRRSADQVNYYINGVRVMRSTKASSGTVYVGSTLYYSGDAIA